MKQAVILLGHADPDSFNAQLAESYRASFVKAGGKAEVFRLAELRFDPILRLGFRSQQTLEPDLVRLKLAIEGADHLVWVFPTYWGSPPAVVRGLFDRLFLPGWAFKYESGSALPKGLLAGRSARVILTMDSPALWYTLINHRMLHRSFGGASLKLCGLATRFTTLYGVHGMKETKRERWRQKVTELATRDANA